MEMSRAVTVVVCALALVLAAPSARAAEPPPTTPPIPPPKAWILVDADTGAVIDGGREREPLRVASVFKLLTAIVVFENLAADTEMPISTRAESMPARKINVKAGQVWRFGDLMHSLLLVSANDAAVALAERTAGSLEQFGGMMDATANRLGLADSPVLRDPAGLDDEFSVDGGNVVSARDMAIVARAFLAYPELAAIVGKPEYRFVGGDGLPHRIVNHVRLLKTYRGAIGLKTGYTKRAGHALVAAATREGRTMVAVVIGAANPYGSAAALLDRGFALPVAEQVGADRLPPVRLGSAVDPTTLAAPPPRVVSTPAARSDDASLLEHDRALSLALLVFGGSPAVGILVRRSRHRRASVGAAPWRV